MKEYDAVIIGGGVIGCFAARNLSRYKLRFALLEAEPDVCRQITRANASVVYAGYDHTPGTVKATYTAGANADMDRLCDELEVPFHRCDGLMTAEGPKGEAMLSKKLQQGLLKNVPNLRLLSAPEVLELEPQLSKHVTAALLSPTTGTVNPWQLGIAAYENARQNGCEAYMGTRVVNIRFMDGRYVLETNSETFSARMVLNCAGLAADRVREMIAGPSVRLRIDASDFLVFDRRIKAPSHVLFQETENGKGVTVVPTTGGNLLAAAPARAFEGEAFSTTETGLHALRSSLSAYLPTVDLENVIRHFGAMRPNPYHVVYRDGEWVDDGSRIGSFIMESTAPGFISLLGIKTPGLTCADQIGRYLADQTAAYLNLQKQQNFDPKRKAIRTLNVAAHTADREIVCRCEQITKAEVLEAIARGAKDLTGVKHRVGTGMGPCQGSRCSRAIARLIGENSHETC